MVRRHVYKCRHAAGWHNDHVVDTGFHSAFRSTIPAPRPTTSYSRASGRLVTLTMNHPQPERPHFRHPPVAEVALSVAFNAVPRLTAAEIGRYWVEKLRADFPSAEEHGPVEPQVELFDRSPIPPLRIEAFADAPPPPRMWFKPETGDAGTKLIQVQNNWFACNWRREGGPDDYPRWEAIEAFFVAQYQRFAAFIEESGFGGVAPHQCEVTYVNPIDPNELWRGHGEPHKILSLLTAPDPGAFLGVPEDLHLQGRWIIERDGEPIGRFHVNAQPAYRNKDAEPVLLLTLTARGRPASVELGDVVEFMRVGHDWIVNGFVSITTAEMQERVWERIE